MRLFVGGGRNPTVINPVVCYILIREFSFPFAPSGLFRVTHSPAFTVLCDNVCSFQRPVCLLADTLRYSRLVCLSSSEIRHNKKSVKNSKSEYKGWQSKAARSCRTP